MSENLRKSRKLHLLNPITSWSSSCIVRKHPTLLSIIATWKLRYNQWLLSSKVVTYFVSVFTNLKLMDAWSIDLIGSLERLTSWFDQFTWTFDFLRNVNIAKNIRILQIGNCVQCARFCGYWAFGLVWHLFEKVLISDTLHECNIVYLTSSRILF